VTVLLAHYLDLLERSQLDLSKAFRQVATDHREEPDVFHECHLMAAQCEDHAERLKPFTERYGEEAEDEPDRLHSELFVGTRTGPLGLLRDLHDLYLMACECDISWTLIGQAAQGARDTELHAVVQRCEGETAIQLRWLVTRMKQAAPQVLVVAS
jgi:uncharacterized protein YdiU (UPF0061 family)